MCIYCGIKTDYSPNACMQCIGYLTLRSIYLAIWNADESLALSDRDIAYEVTQRHNDMPEPFVATDGIFIPEIDAEWDEPDYEAFVNDRWYEDDSREDYTPMFRTWGV